MKVVRLKFCVFTRRRFRVGRLSCLATNSLDEWLPLTLTMKICNLCRTEKTETEFYTCKGKLRSRCKNCFSSGNKSQNRKAVVQRYNPTVKNRLQNRFSSYKSRAKKRDVIFRLTIEQFALITSKPCIYCGGFIEGKDFCGIDRLDSAKGYLFENCVSCCYKCNLMKRDYSRDSFLLHIDKIARHQEK